MNIAPSFLRKTEPAIEPIPQHRQPAVSPEVAAFIDSTTRQREELAYLRSENEQFERELKLANERIRMLETELTEVRRDRDWLQMHDSSMLTSLDNIETLIVAAKAKARAEAHAPPGSGQKQEAKDEAIDRAAAELAKAFAPEGGNDAS